MKSAPSVSLVWIVVIALHILVPRTACFVVPSSCTKHANPTPILAATTSNNNDGTYYTYKSKKRMELPALMYSICSNAVCKILRRQYRTVAPSPNDDDPQRPSPRQRVAIVTGSNTGVGYETAKSLVEDHGYVVIVAARSPDKGMHACARINGAAATAALEASSSSRGMAVWEGPLDLSDLDSVRSFARRIRETYNATGSIDVLINNAGVNSAGAAAAPSPPPHDGQQQQQQQQQQASNLDVVFSANFLGHFLLTNLLLDQCRRVVNLSSVMHHFPVYSRSRERDEDHDVGSAAFWKDKAVMPSDATDGKQTVRKTYGPSKLAAVLFTSELQRRYGAGKSIAVNPGAVSSDIWRNYSRARQRLFRLLYLTPEQGCLTSVAAAVLDWHDEEENGGAAAANRALYLQPYRLPGAKKDRAPFPLFEMLGPYKGYQATAPRLPKDGGVRASQALFEVCEELTQCRFPR